MANVFACTGSGKTLTSFKLAQLLRDENAVDRVIFLIDRKDLDDQTIDEYNSFEKDCVDRSTNTYALTKRLEDKSQKLIVTTIQKLANASNNPRFDELIEKMRNEKKHMAIILDEYGQTEGLITLEDVMEEIVGDIIDEHDKVAQPQLDSRYPGGDERFDIPEDERQRSHNAEHGDRAANRQSRSRPYAGGRR